MAILLGMKTWLSRSLDVQIDLHGWSVSMPRVEFSGGRSFVFVWHLGFGLLFSASASIMGILPYLQGESGGLLMLVVGLLFAVVGLLMSGHAVYQLVSLMQSVRLMVAGADMRIQHRMLGVAFRVQQVALKDLGPITFSGSRWNTRVGLGENLQLAAFVDEHYQSELARFLTDSIQQAQAAPDALPAPPVQLQRMLHHSSAQSR